MFESANKMSMIGRNLYRNIFLSSLAIAIFTMPSNDAYACGKWLFRDWINQWNVAMRCHHAIDIEHRSKPQHKNRVVLKDTTPLSKNVDWRIVRCDYGRKIQCRYDKHLFTYTKDALWLDGERIGEVGIRSIKVNSRSYLVEIKENKKGSELKVLLGKTLILSGKRLRAASTYEGKMRLVKKIAVYLAWKEYFYSKRKSLYQK